MVVRVIIDFRKDEKPSTFGGQFDIRSGFVEIGVDAQLGAVVECLCVKLERGLRTLERRVAIGERDRRRSKFVGPFVAVLDAVDAADDRHRRRDDHAIGQVVDGNTKKHAGAGLTGHRLCGQKNVWWY